MTNTDSAAGEAMPKFAPDLTVMSLDELATVYDQFMTISNVCSGMQSQPRAQMSDRAHTLNKAGEIVDDLQEVVNTVLSNVVAEALKRKPVNEKERGYRFYLAVTGEVWTNANPECVSILVQAVINEMPSKEELEARS